MSNINHLASLPMQLRKIVARCQDVGSITTIEAASELRITSLQRRLSDLRERGYVVHKTERFTSKGRRYFRYFVSSRPVY